MTGFSTLQSGDFDVFDQSQELENAETDSEPERAGDSPASGAHLLAKWAVEAELRGGWTHDFVCADRVTWAPFHELVVRLAERLALGSDWVLHAASGALGLTEGDEDCDEGRRACLEAKIDETLSLLQPYPVLDPAQDLLQSVATARSLADVRDSGGRLLLIVLQFAMLRKDGLDPKAALDALDQRYGRFGGRDIIELLRVDVREQLLSDASPTQGLRMGSSAGNLGVPIAMAPVGSVLQQPVRTRDGQLLLAAGCTLLPTLLERLQALVATGRIEDLIVVGSPSES